MFLPPGNDKMTSIGNFEQEQRKARLKNEIFNLRIWAYSRKGRAHAGKVWE